MSETDFLLEITDMSLEKNQQNYETIFSLSNGYLGTRGSKEEDFILNKKADQGTFVNGFYESEPIVYGEAAYGYAKDSQTIARVPNAKQFMFSFNGTPFSKGKISNEHHYLDMKKGILYRSFTWVSQKDEVVEVKTERFVSMTNKHYLFNQYEVTPVTHSGLFEFHGEFTTNDRVLEEDDDPRKAKSMAHLLTTQVLLGDEKEPYLETRTSHSGLCMMSSLTLSTDQEKILPRTQSTSTGYHYDFEVEVAKGNSYAVRQQVYYGESYETEFLDYLSEKAAHEAYWLDFWEMSDIQIEGDPTLQKGIRHNLFHLNQAAGRDGKTNISAKGITSDGYEGHYFWDTEMYMIPFFIYTQPEVAKKLLMYRYSILNNAKKRAEELGISSGVLFPWRTINGEECSAYYPAGTAQVHINGDISYAIQTYVNVTGDTQFMEEYGAEMMVEIARFWLSFGTFNQDEFMINGVTGPDEYTALVNNNFYTNKLAKYNLECAVNLIQESPYLQERLAVQQDEIEKWALAAKLMRLPYDKERGLTLQDDGMVYRQVWPFETTPKEKYPLLLHYHPMMIYKHQVNKQADTVLSQYLFEGDFTREQLARDYAYYESITTHDSSLSRSIFGIMGTRINEVEKAYDYFMDTVSMDLDDVQGNTIDGIHAANLGGMWLGLVKGFGGVTIQDKELHISPVLPDKWQSLTFCIKYQSRVIRVFVSHKEVRVTLVSGEKITLAINKQSVILESGLVITL